MTAPAAGATVVGTINLTANAADNSAVAGVQFKVDGANVGAADTSSPYSASWDSRALANGTALDHRGRHRRRRQRDHLRHRRGRRRQPPGRHQRARGRVRLRGAGRHGAHRQLERSRNHGTLGSGARTTSGRFGEALTFGGGAASTIPDSGSLDLSTAMTVEAWVNPATATAGWRPAVLKEQTFGLVYGLYGSTGAGPPSGHVFTNGEDDVRGTAALPANTWSHVATT